MTSSYYDLDDILSQELVPCWTNLDFTYLATLDPDYHPEDDKNQQQINVLSAGCKIKMPIWAVQEWAPKGWVKMVLPRIYGKKARERLQADPLQVDLSKRNQHFFGTGVALLGLWEKTWRALSNTSVRSTERRQWQQRLDQLQDERGALRDSLVSTYTGDRLQRTMNWSWSAVADDVSALTDQLTVWEMRLFLAGATAMQHSELWQQQGKRRSLAHRVVVTPDNGPSKRPRLE